MSQLLSLAPLNWSHYNFQDLSTMTLSQTQWTIFLMVLLMPSLQGNISILSVTAEKHDSD